MAEKLDGWPEGTEPGQSKYPWDEWLDGSVWKLRQGVDLAMSASNFRKGTLGPAAARHGLRVRARVVDDGKAVIFQALPRGKA